jgi:lipid A 3-O-deacylase
MLKKRKKKALYHKDFVQLSLEAFTRGCRYIFVLMMCTYTASAHEVRIGLLKHDVKNFLEHAYERGATLQGEWLFPRATQALSWIFSPHPHVGVNKNLSGYTDNAYAGLTWRLELSSTYFLELSFGGSIHNGKLTYRTRHHKDYGTRVLFREGIALGAEIGGPWTLSLTLEHASNARLSKHNPGITHAGVRLGYAF